MSGSAGSPDGEPWVQGGATRPGQTGTLLWKPGDSPRVPGGPRGASTHEA